MAVRPSAAQYWHIKHRLILSRGTHNDPVDRLDINAGMIRVEKEASRDAKLLRVQAHLRNGAFRAENTNDKPEVEFFGHHLGVGDQCASVV